MLLGLLSRGVPPELSRWSLLIAGVGDARLMGRAA